jgi:hypothetical protein
MDFILLPARILACLWFTGGLGGGNEEICEGLEL